MGFFFSLIRRCVDPLWRVFQQTLRRWTKPDNRLLPVNAALNLDRGKLEMILEGPLPARHGFALTFPQLGLDNEKRQQRVIAGAVEPAWLVVSGYENWSVIGLF